MTRTTAATAALTASTLTRSCQRRKRPRATAAATSARLAETFDVWVSAPPFAPRCKTSSVRRFWRSVRSEWVAHALPYAMSLRRIEVLTMLRCFAQADCVAQWVSEFTDRCISIRHSLSERTKLHYVLPRNYYLRHFTCVCVCVCVAFDPARLDYFSRVLSRPGDGYCDEENNFEACSECPSWSVV